MTIGVGVIGVGYLGRHHARIYSELEGVRLAAVADTEFRTAEETANRYGAMAYADYRDMIGKVTAVSVVTPTVTHFGIAMDCLRAGVDVLLEKPITATVAEAETLVAEAGRLGRRLQVGHLERFNPAVVALSDYLETPIFIEAERLGPFQQRGLDVDVTLDLMIHDVDIVMGLLPGAEVCEIRGLGGRVLSEKLDVARAWLEFDNGVKALISASRVSSVKERVLKLYQKDSFVVLDYQLMRITRHFRSGGGVSTETVDVESREPLREEIIDFIDCVKTGRRPRVSGLEGKKALEVVMAITDRIKGTGRWVI